MIMVTKKEIMEVIYEMKRDEGFVLTVKNNSIRLPPEVLEYLKIKPGDEVAFDAIGNDVITIRKHIEK